MRSTVSGRPRSCEPAQSSESRCVVGLLSFERPNLSGSTSDRLFGSRVYFDRASPLVINDGGLGNAGRSGRPSDLVKVMRLAPRRGFEFGPEVKAKNSTLNPQRMPTPTKDAHAPRLLRVRTRAAAPPTFLSAASEPKGRCVTDQRDRSPLCTAHPPRALSRPTISPATLFVPSLRRAPPAIRDARTLSRSATASQRTSEPSGKSSAPVAKKADCGHAPSWGHCFSERHSVPSPDSTPR